MRHAPKLLDFTAVVLFKENIGADLKVHTTLCNLNISVSTNIAASNSNKVAAGDDECPSHSSMVMQNYSLND